MGISVKDKTSIKGKNIAIKLKDLDFSENNIGRLTEVPIYPTDYVCFVDADCWNSVNRTFITKGSKKITLVENETNATVVDGWKIYNTYTNQLKSLGKRDISFNIGTGDFTAYTVITLKNDNTTCGLKESYYNSAGGKYRWGVDLDTVGNVNSSVKNAITFNWNNGSSWVRYSSGLTDMVKGNTYAACVTRKDGVLTFYISGINVGTADFAETITVESYGEITVQTKDDPFYCSAVFNRALSLDEVKQLNAYSEYKYGITLNTVTPTYDYTDYLLYVDASCADSTDTDHYYLDPKGTYVTNSYVNYLYHATATFWKISNNALVSNPSYNEATYYKDTVSFYIGTGDFTIMGTHQLTTSCCTTAISETTYSGGSGRWHCRLSTLGSDSLGSNFAGVGLAQNTGSWKMYYPSTNANTKLNGYYCWVVTRKDGVLTFYINGKSFGTCEFTGNMTVNSQQRIAVSLSSNPLYCSAVWNRALSSGEITQLTTDTASKYNLTLSEV